jgi:hypothetical protein
VGFFLALAAVDRCFALVPLDRSFELDELDRPPDLLRSAIAANDTAGPTYFSTGNLRALHGAD